MLRRTCGAQDLFRRRVPGFSHQVPSLVARTSIPVAALRFLTKTATEATRSIPKTPDGNNPYKVLGVDLTTETTLDDVKGQFKKLAVRFHPDAEGGSNEAMAEINAAHKIIRENHVEALRCLREYQAGEASAESAAAAGDGGSARRRQRRSRGRPDRTPRDTKEEDLGRTGGVSGTQKVRDFNQRKWKNSAEIEAEWVKLKDDTIERTQKMCTRFELALEQSEYFKETASAAEITVRERWLRKQFVKLLWEDVHEMRSELLKRGARNLQQQELAEEMVAFATQTQKKLNEDFGRQAQRAVKASVQIFVERLVKIVFTITFIVYVIYTMATGFWRHSFVRTYKPGFLGA